MHRRPKTQYALNPAKIVQLGSHVTRRTRLPTLPTMCRIQKLAYVVASMLLWQAQAARHLARATHQHAAIMANAFTQMPLVAATRDGKALNVMRSVPENRVLYVQGREHAWEMAARAPSVTVFLVIVARPAKFSVLAVQPSHAKGEEFVNQMEPVGVSLVGGAQIAALNALDPVFSRAA